MDPITDLLTQLVNSGIVDHVSLLLLIIGLMVWGHRNILVPLKEKVDKIASYDEVKNYVEEIDSDHMEAVAEVSKKLEKLLDKLNEVEGYAKDNSREILELKRDIEQIKQILNQFQGHLMYGGGRDTGSFGNRELK